MYRKGKREQNWTLEKGEEKKKIQRKERIKATKIIMEKIEKKRGDEEHLLLLIILTKKI